MSRKRKTPPYALLVRMPLELRDAIDYFCMRASMSRNGAIRYLVREGLIRHGVLKPGEEEKEDVERNID